MTLPIFQRTIVNDAGDVIPGASVEVRRESDNALVQLFSDRNGTVLLSNPTTADANGFVQFFASPNIYKIAATSSGGSVVWRYVDIGPSYTPAGAGAVAMDVQSKLRESVSITDAGASPFATAAMNTAAIQAVLNDAAGKHRVYVPAGIYIVNDKIRIPSNTYIYGDGASSVIRMASSVGRQITVIQTGTRNQKRENIVIENLTVDFNRDRWTVVGGGSADFETVDGEVLNTNAIALNICYSEYVVVRNVRCLDGWKHSLDIQAPKYVEGTNGATYDPQPSRNVWVENCYIEGGGDDNLTTHFSSDIWITNCTSVNPSGVRTGGNSNCYEIDDGTRNAFITNCVAIGGVCGLQIKGHNYAPAPYNVVVDGMRCINNAIGVEVRHTGWYGADEIFSGNGVTATFTLPANYFGDGLELFVYVGGVLTTAYTLNPSLFTITFNTPPPSGTNNVKVSLDSDEIIDEDGNPIQFTGASPTARNITLNNIELIAPRTFSYNDIAGGTGARTVAPLYALRIRSYENITLSNIRANDGSLDLAGDYASAQPLTSGMVMRFYSGARNFDVSNVSVYGFEYCASAISFTASARGVFNVNGLTTTAGPARAIRAASGPNAVYRLLVDNVVVAGVDNPSDAAPIFINTPNSVVGRVTVSGGYVATASGSVGASATDLPSRIVRRRAKSTGNETTTPNEIDVFVWEEGVQDLGAGEGMMQAWKARLIGESFDRTIGRVGFRKPTSADTKTSDFVVQVAASNTLDPVDCFVVSTAGQARPGADNLYTLGIPAFRWFEAYAASVRPGDGTVIWTSGVGTPEGVVVAAIGSLFTRTDGGANTTLYVKQSGTGNTGWVAK
jgi:hypothetical protein